MSPAALGLFIGSITAGFVFGSFLSGRYAGRYPLTTMMIAGRIVACSGPTICLILLFADVGNVVALLGPCILVGVGNGLTMPSANAGALSVRPDLARSAAGLVGAITLAGGAAAYPAHLAHHPVYTVNLVDIDLYCEWLSRRTGLDVRLPTESEWEYAGGNGFGWQYAWGDDFAPFQCNTNEMLLQSTTPVGIFWESTNRWGVSDLIGNVEEFVATDYTPYPGARVVEDDLYRKLGNYRIAKGGAFNRFSDLARVQWRHGAYPSSLYAIGFRVAHSYGAFELDDLSADDQALSYRSAADALQ